MRTATWKITDTMAVKVEVIHIADNGQAKIRATSGEQWVRLDELQFEGGPR